MPLDQPGLASALAAIYAALPDAEPSAEQMAQAYADYAMTGTFGGGIAVVTGVHKDAFKATMLAAIDPPIIGLPATIGAAWAAAVTAFWTLMPIAGGAVGVSDGIPGASSLVGSLSAVYANLANTPEVCGAGVAAALHTATMTVTATVTPPIPAAPVPIV